MFVKVFVKEFVKEFVKVFVKVLGFEYIFIFTETCRAHSVGAIKGKWQSLQKMNYAIYIKYKINICFFEFFQHFPTFSNFLCILCILYILLVEYASTPTVYVPRQRHYAAARVTKEKTGEHPKRKWPSIILL